MSLCRRLAEAEKLCNSAVMIVQKASGRLNHPDVAQILNTIGWIMGGSDRLDEAAVSPFSPAASCVIKTADYEIKVSQ